MASHRILPGNPVVDSVAFWSSYSGQVFVTNAGLALAAVDQLTNPRAEVMALA